MWVLFSSSAGDLKNPPYRVPFPRNCRTCLESPLLKFVGEGEPGEPALERILSLELKNLPMGARNRVEILE